MWQSANSRSLGQCALEAQLAIAQGAYFPTLNADASASRSSSDRLGAISPIDTKSASLSLSYLIYDFGARGADDVDRARRAICYSAEYSCNGEQSVYSAFGESLNRWSTLWQWRWLYIH